MAEPSNNTVFVSDSRLLDTMSFAVDYLNQYRPSLIVGSSTNQFDWLGYPAKVIPVKDVGFRFFFYIRLSIQILIAARASGQVKFICLGERSAFITAVVLKLKLSSCRYVICLHDEIRISPKRSLINGIIHRVQQRTFHACSHHVVQDSWRRRVIGRIYKIPKRKFSLFASASFLPAVTESSPIINKYFDSPAISLLWIGRERPFEGFEAVVEGLDQLNDVQLVIKSRSVDNMKAIISKSKSARSKFQFISEEFPYNDVFGLYRAADIGVVFFESSDLNSRWIGYSSGKLNYFLAAGKPCLVSNNPGLRWVQTCGAGVICTTPTDISAAVYEICSNYSLYSYRARQAYEMIRRSTQ